MLTCYIGLHHMTVDQLQPFLASVHRVLRPNGLFIVRDHDVTTPEILALVSLAHTVFNAGLGETWETNRGELRYFESVQVWVERLAIGGVTHSLASFKDHTRNTVEGSINHSDSSRIRLIIARTCGATACTISS